MKIRELTVHPSGQRYVAPSDFDDEEEEETLKYRIVRMATPLQPPGRPTEKPKSVLTMDTDEVPEPEQETPMGKRATTSLETVGVSRPPLRFARTALGQGSSDKPRRFKASVRRPNT